jgi:hypothetical protein
MLNEKNTKYLYIILEHGRDKSLPLSAPTLPKMSALLRGRTKN